MQKHPQSLTSRAALPGDEPLLYEIFAADRAQEFDALWLSAEQTAILLELQFRARQAGYARDVPEATDTIVCLHDGTPVGYYRLARVAGGYRVVDLAVLPQFRNQGIGGWALRQLQQRCTAERVSLRLRVHRGNPALALYQRLHFLCVGSDPLSLEMTWSPALQCAESSHLFGQFPTLEHSSTEQVPLPHGNVAAAFPSYNVPEVLFAH